MPNLSGDFAFPTTLTRLFPAILSLPPDWLKLSDDFDFPNPVPVSLFRARCQAAPSIYMYSPEFSKRARKYGLVPHPSIQLPVFILPDGKQFNKF